MFLHALTASLLLCVLCFLDVANAKCLIRKPPSGSAPNEEMALICSGSNLVTVPLPPGKARLHLETLDLSHNQIHLIQRQDFEFYGTVQYLTLSFNVIKTLQKDTFSLLPYLKVLNLQNNRIRHIAKGAFEGLPYLEVLDLKQNRIRTLSHGLLTPLVSLETISLDNNPIKYINEGAFSGLPRLQSLVIRGGPVKNVHPTSFDYLPSLWSLTIGPAKFEAFPLFNGTHAVENLRIVLSSLRVLPDDFCVRLPELRSLDLKMNNLVDIQQLSHCSHLRDLMLSENNIEDIDGKLDNLVELVNLDLSDNNLNRLTESSFCRNKRLRILKLNGNRLRSIEGPAFKNLESLTHLGLSDNRFHHLDLTGLSDLQQLLIRNNPLLGSSLQGDSVPRVRLVEADHPYQCCYFAAMTYLPQREDVIMTEDVAPDTVEFGWSDEGRDTHTVSDMSTPAWQLVNLRQPVDVQHATLENSSFGQAVTCFPQPDVFYPCSDLFSESWLRVMAWAVFLMAFLTNMIVLGVMLANLKKIDVPRFLVTNLAFADLCLGVYLAMLAIADLNTRGNYKAHALAWQFSRSCKVAGFLAVFSSELSVFSLTAITVERAITIWHALRADKRMSKHQAVLIMVIGWLFAVAVAVLPLFHVSSYSKYSLCLPFDAQAPKSKFYLMGVLVVNLVSFLVVFVSYTGIYFIFRPGHIRSRFYRDEVRMAKKMALLVLTDFLCWTPIAIIAAPAVLGNPLAGMSLFAAKVMAVLVFPLNACANPLLYGLLTKQFRVDARLLFSSLCSMKFLRVVRVRWVLISGDRPSLSMLRLASSFSSVFRRSSNSSTSTQAASLMNASQGPVQRREGSCSSSTCESGKKKVSFDAVFFASTS